MLCYRPIMWRLSSPSLDSDSPHRSPHCVETQSAHLNTHCCTVTLCPAQNRTLYAGTPPRNTDPWRGWRSDSLSRPPQLPYQHHRGRLLCSTPTNDFRIELFGDRREVSQEKGNEPDVLISKRVLICKDIKVRHVIYSFAATKTEIIHQAIHSLKQCRRKNSFTS